MRALFKIGGAAGALAMLTACASFDHQDVYLLGGANEQNVALQSVRDVNLPNSREVEFYLRRARGQCRESPERRQDSGAAPDLLRAGGQLGCLSPSEILNPMRRHPVVSFPRWPLWSGRSAWWS